VWSVRFLGRRIPAGRQFLKLKSLFEYGKDKAVAVPAAAARS